MKNIWKSSVAGVAAIILLTVAAYIPAMRGGFIWDDDRLITSNRMIQASDGLRRIWSTTEAVDYYPVTWSLCWLEWRFWGNSAAGYHAVNVLLHAVNAVLVWMVLRRLKIPGAWLAGLVFAIHPVNVATVAWISEQKNTLSMLFYAVAILLYLRFDGDGRWQWYGFSLGAFLLALLSKTAAVMLPVVLLGCAWWMRGRLRSKDWLCCVPFFILSLVLGLVTVWFQHYRELQGHLVRSDGFLARLAAAGWAPWFYLYKALLPVNLALMYPKWSIDASRWGSYVPGTLLIVCFLVFWRERRTWGHPLLFGLGYFVVMFFPVLGFFDISFHQQSLVADHWQYYPILGPIALATGAGAVVCRRMGSQRRYWETVATVAALTVLGAATWQRGRVYAAEETLWRDTVAKNPNNWLAHYNLGVALARLGRLQEAVGQYERALRIEPHHAETHHNLGLALEQMGKVPEAAEHYEEALRIEPNYPRALNNLAWLLATHASADGGDPIRAAALAERVCKLTDNRVATYLDTLAAAYAAAGRFDDAVGTAEKAIQLADSTAQTQLVSKIEVRLELYRVDRAYYEPKNVTGSRDP